MVKIKSRSTDLLVTPNHNMYVRTHNEFNFGRLPGFVPASGMNLVLYRIPMGGKFIPESKTIPKEIMYLIGLYVSEGFFKMWRKKKKLTICQNKGKKMDRMMEWVSTMNPRLNGNRRFVVDLDDEWVDFIIKNCGEGKYNKFMSPAVLSNEYLDCLFDAMMAGDGCDSMSCKGYHQMTYYTTSPKLAEGFEELCLKLGYETTTRSRAGRKSAIKGRVINSAATQYDIHVRRSNNKKIIPRIHLKHEVYDGMVYCVEVPNHTLYVKRNGYCSWCGNSGSTAVACKQTGRNYIGFEISPAYVAYAEARLLKEGDELK